MNYAQQNYAVKMFKLLSNANRLRIIEFLSQDHLEPPTAGMIADRFGA